MNVALAMSCDPHAEDIAIAVADDLALAALLLVTSDPQRALASKLELESQGYYVVCAHTWPARRCSSCSGYLSTW